jgi:ABC transporter C-terminal domain
VSAPSGPSYDPLAPRLRPPGSPADRQAREREAQKARKRSAELEKKIAEKEQQVRDVETLMASPGFYDDRAAAEKSVEDRKRLLSEVDALMAEWEAAQSAAEMKA